MRAGLRNVLRVAVAAAVIVYAVSAGAQAPASKTPPIVGIRTLNPEKSHVSAAPDGVEIRQYTVRPDGFLVGRAGEEDRLAGRQDADRQRACRVL